MNRILLSLWSGAFWIGAPQGVLSEADRAWESLARTPSSPRAYSPKSMIEFYEAKERGERGYRDQGYRFWKAYPDDPRRYQWLLATVAYRAPFYWGGDPHLAAKAYFERIARGEETPIAYDRDAIRRWEAIYPALRQTYLSSEAVSEKQKMYLLHGEIRSLFERMYHAPGREPGGMASVLKVLRLLDEYTDRYLLDLDREEDFRTEDLYYKYVGWFCTYRHAWNLSFEDLRFIAEHLSKRSAPIARARGQKMLELLALRETPFSQTWTTIDGGEMTPESRKGKVALYYIWNCG